MFRGQQFQKIRNAPRMLWENSQRAPNVFGARCECDLGARCECFGANSFKRFATRPECIRCALWILPTHSGRAANLLKLLARHTHETVQGFQRAGEGCKYPPTPIQNHDIIVSSHPVTKFDMFCCHIKSIFTGIHLIHSRRYRHAYLRYTKTWPLTPGDAFLIYLQQN